MDDTVYALLNDQINKELYSAYLYLDMANFYSSKGLDGFAAWYEVQAKEEQDHAMRIYRYLHDNDRAPQLEAIAKPDKVFSELIDPIKIAYEHEKYVTSLIHAIYAAAAGVNDYRCMQFLDWFVEEQGEEEKNASDMLNKMELVGKDACGLYLLDAELAKRE